MTLNAVIAFILRFLPNWTDFQADYITVVEYRPIGLMSFVFLCTNKLVSSANSLTVALGTQF